MLEEFEDWIKKNIECCACGGSMEENSCVNVVELKKVATWKFPVFGSIDVPGFKPRALAVVCEECERNKVKIQRCIEWEGSPYLVTYHNVDDLEDDKQNMSLLDFVFGKLYQQRNALRVAKQACEN